MNETHAIRRIFGKKIVKVSACPLSDNSGMSNRIASKKAGILRYAVQFSDGTDVRFIGKRKSAAIIARGIFMLSGGDPLLFLLLVKNHKIIGYNGSFIREACLYNSFDNSLKKYLPDTIGSAASRLRGECFIAMEELPPNVCTAVHVFPMIDAIAQFHARYYGDTSCVKKLGINCYASDDYRKTRRCLKRMFKSLSDENYSVFGKEKLEQIYRFIDNIHNEFALVEKRRTLTHNDYSLRNICIKNGQICIYDWELACFQNPEHDIAELLISVMHDMTDSEIITALGYYRKKLSELTGKVLSDKEYFSSLRFNTLEFCVNKLSILRIAGNYLKLSYTHKLAENTARMLDVLKYYEKR